MIPHAQVVGVVAGTVAYIALMNHWFFKSQPSVQIEHVEKDKYANVNFITLTSTPCVPENTIHKGLECLQYRTNCKLRPVTTNAVVGEPMFRADNITSLYDFEDACQVCSVHTEISYKNEYGIVTTKKIPWSHSLNHFVLN